MHTLVHTNMSETDAGCHARPPTVHNERHSPFCSGSPTVNTILSHWASFPPLVPSLLSVPLFSLFNISFSIHFGATVERLRGKSESRWWESDGGSRSAGQLGDQRGAVLVTSPCARPVYLQGLVRTRALTVPGHLRSSAGWVEGGRGGATGLSTSLAARQSALWDPACLLDHRGHKTHPPTHRGAQWEAVLYTVITNSVWHKQIGLLVHWLVVHTFC